MRNYDLAKEHMTRSQHQAEVQRLRNAVKNDGASSIGTRLLAKLNNRKPQAQPLDVPTATTLKPSRSI